MGNRVRWRASAIIPLLLALTVVAAWPAPHNVVAAKDVVFQAGATATGNGTTLSVGGLAALGAQVTGTFVGTVAFETTVNGTWVPLALTSVSTGVTATTATASGAWTGNIAGLDQVRMRVSAYTSGAIRVDGKATANGGGVGASASGGGGGGPATIADGADVALGSTTDAATSGAGTLNAHARQTALNTANIPAVGQATMAASMPVVISSNQSSLPVTTTLPAQAALADATANPTTTSVGAFNEVWDLDTTTWNRWPARTLANWEQTQSSKVPGVAATSLLFDAGSSYVRERSNFNASLLASSARTATTNSTDQTNINARGLRVFLNVTVASGTGGLQVLIQDKDSISANYVALNNTPIAVTATGQYLYVLYPGIGASSGGITQATSQVLSTTWRVSVVAGDASSYTYSVSAAVMR